MTRSPIRILWITSGPGFAGSYLALDLRQMRCSRSDSGPKWDVEKDDGELIDDASRFNDDAALSKATYERGMAKTFEHCATFLNPDGKMIVVFANKQPDAWETLVSAMIRAGFVVDGSWPIATEQAARMRAQSSAALASSVWLVCKSALRPLRPGWDNKVLEEMRERIGHRRHETIGMLALPDQTLSGQRPDRRWRRIASIRS